MKVDALLRPNIRGLKPYSSARDEFTGKAEVYLDANENALGSPIGSFNRYPDPYQREVKAKLAAYKGLSTDQIFLGNGSDEAIDLLFRAFCEPGLDEVILVPPTYGMYKVCAGINDIGIVEVPLLDNYQLDVPNLKAAYSERTKLLFICSPNNPTGNSINAADVLEILNSFPGIVIVDEAYIDFSSQDSFVSLLPEGEAGLGDYDRLVILQTFSKAWGLAGLRLGIAFSNPEIIQVLNRIKPPYNVNSLTQEKALEALGQIAKKEVIVQEILSERRRLSTAFRQMPFVQKVLPSDANFLLVQLPDPRGTYEQLLAKGIVVRDRSKVLSCEGCLRFTVGTTEENDLLIKELQNINGCKNY
ncbi:MAG: histidinol-phosphate transaminase [Bacteroidota bacterium]